MKEIVQSKSESSALALNEFHNFQQNITNHGIEMTIFTQSSDETPDSVFPDWFTTHRSEDIPDGILILYPMKCHSRSTERDSSIIEALKSKFKDVIDLTHFERQGLALEGKGSLVVDYRNH